MADYNIRITTDTNDAIAGINQFGGSLDLLNVKLRDLGNLGESEFSRISSAIQNLQGGSAQQGGASITPFSNLPNMGDPFAQQQQSDMLLAIKELKEAIIILSHRSRGGSTGGGSAPPAASGGGIASEIVSQAMGLGLGFAMQAVGQLATSQFGNGPSGHMMQSGSNAVMGGIEALIGVLTGHPLLAMKGIADVGGGVLGMAKGANEPVTDARETGRTQYFQRHNAEANYALNSGIPISEMEKGNQYMPMAAGFGMKPLETMVLLETARVNAVSVEQLANVLVTARGMGIDPERMAKMTGSMLANTEYADPRQMAADSIALGKQMGGTFAQQPDTLMQTSLLVAQTFAQTFAEKLGGQDAKEMKGWELLMQKDAYFKNNPDAQRKALVNMAGGGISATPDDMGKFGAMLQAGIDPSEAIEGVRPEHYDDIFKWIAKQTSKITDPKQKRLRETQYLQGFGFKNLHETHRLYDDFKENGEKLDEAATGELSEMEGRADEWGKSKAGEKAKTDAALQAKTLKSADKNAERDDEVARRHVGGELKQFGESIDTATSKVNNFADALNKALGGTPMPAQPGSPAAARYNDPVDRAKEAVKSVGESIDKDSSKPGGYGAAPMDTRAPRGSMGDYLTGKRDLGELLPWAPYLQDHLGGSKVGGWAGQVGHELGKRTKGAVGQVVGALKGSLQPPLQGKITSGFGDRTDPITGKKSFHSGIDIAGKQGTDVHSAMAGTVEETGYNSGYGNYVTLKDDKGVSTKYAHLSAIDVKRGQKISRGQDIGDVGSTGRSTGPHLHMEAMKDGKFLDPSKMISWGSGGVVDKGGGGGGFGGPFFGGSQMNKSMQSILKQEYTPTGIGDHGTSFGPFQFHYPEQHGLTKAQAMDPVASRRQAEKEYKQHLSQVDSYAKKHSKKLSDDERHQFAAASHNAPIVASPPKDLSKEGWKNYAREWTWKGGQLKSPYYKKPNYFDDIGMRRGDPGYRPGPYGQGGPEYSSKEEAEQGIAPSYADYQSTASASGTAPQIGQIPNFEGNARIGIIPKAIGKPDVKHADIPPEHKEEKPYEPKAEVHTPKLSEITKPTEHKDKPTDIPKPKDHAQKHADLPKVEKHAAKFSDVPKQKEHKADEAESPSVKLEKENAQIREQRRQTDQFSGLEKIFEQDKVSKQRESLKSIDKGKREGSKGDEKATKKMLDKATSKQGKGFLDFLNKTDKAESAVKSEKEEGTSGMFGIPGLDLKGGKISFDPKNLIPDNIKSMLPKGALDKVGKIGVDLKKLPGLGGILGKIPGADKAMGALGGEKGLGELSKHLGKGDWKGALDKAAGALDGKLPGGAKGSDLLSSLSNKDFGGALKQVGGFTGLSKMGVPYAKEIGGFLGGKLPGGAKGGDLMSSLANKDFGQAWKQVGGGAGLEKMTGIKGLGKLAGQAGGVLGQAAGVAGFLDTGLKVMSKIPGLDKVMKEDFGGVDGLGSFMNNWWNGYTNKKTGQKVQGMGEGLGQLWGGGTDPKTGKKYGGLKDIPGGVGKWAGDRAGEVGHWFQGLFGGGDKKKKSDGPNRADSPTGSPQIPVKNLINLGDPSKKPQMATMTGQMRGAGLSRAGGNRYVANVTNNVNVGNMNGADESEIARISQAVRSGTYGAMVEHERRFTRGYST